MATPTMKAAVCGGGNTITVEDVPLPSVGAGEVRVRITACGICGSDLHFYKMGLWAPGSIPGHEMTGVVDTIGEGVRDFERDQPVTIEPIRSCGRCDSCRAGLDAICREMKLHGIHLPGGLAEYVTVPARRLFPISGTVDPIVAALTEPMAVVVHGIRRGALESGQRVLVLGAGTVGLLTVVAARAMGAGEVWLTARHAHQATLGRALGATRVLSEDEARPEGLDALGKESPIDLVVETVGGGAETLISASAAVRPGGTISVVGFFMGRVPIDALSLFMKENSLVFSNCYSRPAQQPDFERAVELVSEHRDAIAPLNTHQRPLAAIGDAFQIAADKKHGAVKVSVVP
jgi:L-iditol 2-dehydrogenase